MTDDQDYGTPHDDEASRLLKKIMSPAEAQSLVPPPPTHAPRSSPGESTPLTGSLAASPPQAAPLRGGTSPRRGLAGFIAGGSKESPGALDRSSDPHYIKVFSKGQVGYLPRTNLRLAREIDSNLKVLSED